MVNPGRDNVAIYGALTFPNDGKGPGFPSEGIPWLMEFGNVAIGINPKESLRNVTLTRNIS